MPKKDGSALEVRTPVISYGVSPARVIHSEGWGGDGVQQQGEG